MGAGAVTLGRREAAANRPFTSPDVSARDLSVLGAVLRGIRDALVHAPVEDLVPYQRVVWRVGDLNHRLVMCDRERLVSHSGPCVVGFFGQRRTGADIAPLEEANTAIVAEFAKYPGILSYSSMELTEGNWANMVLHDDPVDTEYWRRSAQHVQAVQLLSPQYYQSVRIHNAVLSEPLLEDPEIVLVRTKYYAYDGDDVWRAVRDLV